MTSPVYFNRETYIQGNYDFHEYLNMRIPQSKLFQGDSACNLEGVLI